MATLFIPSAQSTISRGVLSMRKPLLPNAVGALALTLYKIVSISVSLQIKEGLTKGHHRAQFDFCERLSYFFITFLLFLRLCIA